MGARIHFLHLFHNTIVHLVNEEDNPTKGGLTVLCRFWALQHPWADLFEEATGVCVGRLFAFGIISTRQSTQPFALSTLFLNLRQDLASREIKKRRLHMFLTHLNCIYHEDRLNGDSVMLQDICIDVFLYLRKI